jgi:hypothetical protein
MKEKYCILFFDIFREYTQISNFTKIHLPGAELFDANDQKDRCDVDKTLFAILRRRKITRMLQRATVKIGGRKDDSELYPVTDYFISCDEP